MSSMFLLCLFFSYLISISAIAAPFPDHKDGDEKVINPEMDSRDDPACGRYAEPPNGWGLDQSRVFQGIEPYSGQFPWAVCLAEAIGRFTKVGASNFAANPIPETIFNTGYEFSDDPMGPAYELIKFQQWHLAGSGVIISENWILTAAHVFIKKWERWNMAAHGGATRCISRPKGGQISQFVLSRLEGKRTLWEHPSYMEARGIIKGEIYDIALVRLIQPFQLPTGTYRGESINRICIFSLLVLRSRGCLKNVYFAGYGYKADPKDIENRGDDPYKELSYFQGFRPSETFCATVLGRELTDTKTCFSPALGQAGINATKLKHLHTTEMLPNPCGGDSGGPFFYYMKFTPPNEPEYYRALAMSTLSGGVYRDKLKNNCANEYLSIKIGPNIPFLRKKYKIKPIYEGAYLGDSFLKFWNDVSSTTDTEMLEPEVAVEPFPNRA